MKNIFVFTICLASASFYVHAGQPSANWSVSVEPPQRFIENKSQFDGKDGQHGTPILYGVDWGATQIYFTPTGLTYRFDKVKHDEQEEWEREREREEKMKQGKPFTRKEDEEAEMETDLVHMEWLNANPAALLTGKEVADDYLSYGIGEEGEMENINHIKGYRKIVYENLYPHIDVEYVFHPRGGIKYKLILHPGADLSKVKMKYSKEVALDAEGNIRLKTKFGDLIDHAPLTFYAKNERREIKSLFEVSNNIVSFHLDDYNTGKTIIIDPWTVTPNMPVANKVYYMKADGSGNAYIYGGDSPYRLQKYNAAGVLQWTYNAPWTAANNWFGALIVDPSGNSYITSGTGVSISKIDNGGHLVWSSNPGNFYEYWTLSFNCDYTQLIVGGTLLTDVFNFKFYGAVFEINLSSGALIRTVVVAGTLVGAPNTPPFIANEVRSLSYSPNGNYYFLTLDTVGMLTPALTLGYRDSSFYNLAYYMPYGQGGTGQGINGISATPYLFYTTNGQVLHRRNIINGNILNTVFIPSGSPEVCSGIAVDSCGNVYVGAIGKVHKYDSNLNLVATATTPGEVYDVSVTTNGEVLACGNGFAMSINMSACDAQRPVCRTTFNVAMSQTDVLCNGGCDGTAMAAPSNGTAPYSYVWSNGQTSQSVTNLCAGIYVVTVTDAANSFSIASVTITEPPVFTVSVTSSVTTCGTSAIATPSSGIAPYTYEWSNGATTPSISSLATGTYSVTVFDGNNCSATGSASVTQSPGLTVSATSTSPACGACDGTATAIPAGGNPPFSYAWSNGDTSQTTSGLCADVYTVTVSETGTGGTAVFWNEDFTNGRGGWTLNNNGPGANGSAPNRWVVNNNRNADCPQCPVAGSGGNYLHVTCDSASFFCAPMGGPSCVYSPGFPVLYNNATDKYATSPNISTIGKTGITLTFGYLCAGDSGIDYGLVRLSNNGGASWTDLPTRYFGTISCTQALINIPAAYENIPNFRIGFRWVNDNDLNGNDPPFLIDDIELSAPVEPCEAVTSVILNSAGGPVVSIDSVKDVSCKSVGDGFIQISVSGGNPPYGYIWTRGDTTEDISGLSGGSYFITVTDTSDCITIETAIVKEPSAIYVTGVITNGGCTVGGSIDISVSGGTSPYAYLWTRGDTSQDISNVQAGAYEVTVTDFNNCTKTSIFNVASPGVFLSLDATDALCGGVSDGAVTTTVLGGFQPYRFIWNTGDTTANLTAVPGGDYTVTVTDNSGCSVTKSATVDAPSVLGMTTSITNVLCESGNNGGIKLNPFGGTPPYEAFWSNGDTTLSIEDLPPGTYSVTLTDAHGCEKDSSISLESVSIYQVAAIVTNALCDGSANGSLQANIINGTTPPYSYQWSTGETSASITNAAPGTYSITVTDSLSCLRSDTAVVATGLAIDETVRNSCPGRASGSIITTVSGGDEPYNYSWSNGAATASLFNIGEGIYSLTVTDQNNCSGNDSMIILTDSSGTLNCDTLVSYDVFSPNGDGTNETWIIEGAESFPLNELQIFNRWGSVVFEAKPYNNDWDGRSKEGELLPTATYYYVLKLNDADEKVYSGNVTLIR